MAYSLGEDQPFRYRGYVYDSDTQLYYLQSRYYDPKIGRFISADVYLSTGQGVIGNNCFAYCGNNPIKHSDADGYSYECIALDDVAYGGGGGGSVLLALLYYCTSQVSDAASWVETTATNAASAVSEYVWSYAQDAATFLDGIKDLSRKIGRKNGGNSNGDRSGNGSDFNKGNLKTVKENKIDEFVKDKLGYDGSAEQFKEDYVFGKGSQFNIGYDTSTGQVYLVGIKDKIVIKLEGVFCK